MKKAIIYVFSGTGNTKRACKLYKDEFEKQGVETTLYDVKLGFDSLPNPNDFDLVGFAYPIHAFNAPYIMLKLAKALPKANLEDKKVKKPYFVIKTSGEPLRINNMSSSKMKGMLSRKGYKMFSEYHYAMPYNMIFRHTDEMTVNMLEALNGLCPIEAREVLSGIEHKLWTVPFAPILAWIMRIEHGAMRVNGKLFKVDKDKCVKCGLCVKNCPAHNIEMDENGKFKFHNDCIMCACCSFNCPTNAFNIALLNGWKVNGKYSYKMPTEKEKDKHAWYCKRAYKRYFANAKAKISSHSEQNNI